MKGYIIIKFKKNVFYLSPVCPLEPEFKRVLS